jgi:hypothetical protein
MATAVDKLNEILEKVATIEAVACGINGTHEVLEKVKATVDAMAADVAAIKAEVCRPQSVGSGRSDENGTVVDTGLGVPFYAPKGGVGRRDPETGKVSYGPAAEPPVVLKDDEVYGR